MSSMGREAGSLLACVTISVGFRRYMSEHVPDTRRQYIRPEPASIPTFTYRKEVYRKPIEIAERSNTKAELAYA